MNEQQLADLFSEQIDRILNGQPTAMVDGLEGIRDLLSLGERLSQVSFQASPVAQAAFQTQLTGWFSLNGSGLGTTVLSLPKILWLVLGGLLVAGGLGLGVLFGNFTGSIFDADNDLPGPQSTVAPASTTSQPDAMPTIQAPETAAPPNSDVPAETKPEATTSLGDTISPRVTSSIGDTLPSATPGSGALPGDTAADLVIGDGSGNGDVAGEDTDGSNNASGQTGDQDDRGHGNDADGFDEDNPGNSSGVPDLSGGSGKSGSGGNSGANSAHNSGGSKGGKGGSKGGRK